MAEEEAEKPKEMIKIVSKEGHEFSVEKQAAMVSNTITALRPTASPPDLLSNFSNTVKKKPRFVI